MIDNLFLQTFNYMGLEHTLYSSNEKFNNLNDLKKGEYSIVIFRNPYYLKNEVPEIIYHFFSEVEVIGNSKIRISDKLALKTQEINEIDATPLWDLDFANIPLKADRYCYYFAPIIIKDMPEYFI
jgi:hypothetical protein